MSDHNLFPGKSLDGEDPFPLRKGDEDPIPWQLKLDGQVAGRWVAGVGTYRALQVGQFVQLMANGMTSHFNSEARLVSSILAVYPPVYALFIYVPQVAMPAQKPFLVTANFFANRTIDMITVWDAKGRNDVPVVQAPM